MIDDNMRSKAAATFGKEFMDVMKVQPLAKNGAVALQQRANARPIPTYKVGGAVKSAPPGPTAAEREEARRQNESLKKAKVTSKEGKVIDSANRSEARYADGGKVEDARVAARMAAGNYKKGGKAKKDGLAVMIAIGKPIKEKATGEKYPSKKAMAKHEAAESAGMERMERMKPVKRAVGGAGKTRKGMMK